MDHVCQNCGHTTQSSSAPRFCSECGNRFGADVQEAATLQPATVQVQDMATVVPGAPPSPTGKQREAIPGYRIVRELGRGGMGVVYEAHEEATGRNVALKLLAAGVDHTEEAAQRFLREGKIAASLSHPRSTFVYDAGEIDNRFYITMELMSGGTVKDIIDREGKLSVTDAVNHTLDMLDGLEAAHTLDIVHRDVKPSNCFVTTDGRVKVGDFGISKSLVSDASLTMTGAFMGTPQFAAPEQIRAGEIDNRTDLYSVGATLFYMLTGRAPFQGDAIQVVADIVSETPPTVQSIEPSVPEGLNQIVSRLMEKDPNSRPQTVGELKLALLPFSDRKSSIGDVGRRMAAFFVDTTLCAVVVNVCLAVLLLLIGKSGALISGDWEVVTISFVAGLLYFAICESRWGRGVGKRLMGLRVINDRGKTPSLPIAFLRAAIVPGVANAIRSFAPIIYSEITGTSTQQVQSGAAGNSGALLMFSVVFPGLALASGLALLITMRRKNGYRGVHELVTKTRVVRTYTQAKRSTPPLTVPTAESVTVSDQYDVAGKLCETPEYAIYSGTDKTLARPVWLLRSKADSQPFSPDRMGISRGTRQHILRHHSLNGHRWDAMEAVSGVPLRSVDLAEDSYPWAAVREALIDLAEELQEASADGTLPEQLTLDQVWLDTAGRVKLLDRPVLPANNQTTPESLSAVQLLKQVLEHCRPVLPGQGLDLLNEVDSRPDSRLTIDWILSRLRELGHRPGPPTWDERLGMIAVSFGTEFTLMQSFNLILAIIVHAIAPEPLIASMVWVPIGIAILLPLVVGFFFRGGPVFRVAGVQVRRKGKPASALRCAIRTLITWLPATLGSALLMWFVGEMIQGSDSGGSLQQAIFFAIIFIGMMVFAVGAFAAVLLPRKGLQDYAVGTELVVE